MWLWDEMRTKFGFDEGGTLPVEAWEVRDLLIDLVNTMKQGSWEAITFDGHHNPCMILIKDGDKFLEEDPAELTDILEAIDSSDILYDMVKIQITVIPESEDMIQDFAKKWKSGEIYLIKEEA